ncbi:MAG TPA: PAS domain-containing protein, partial [Gemmatimonadaceae bacterium]
MMTPDASPPTAPRHDDVSEARSIRLATSRSALWIALGALAAIAFTVLAMSAYQRSTYDWVEHSRVVFQTGRAAVFNLARTQQTLADEARRNVPTSVDTTTVRDVVLAPLDTIVALTSDNARQNAVARELQNRARRWGSVVATSDAAHAAVPAETLSVLAHATDSTAQVFLNAESRLYNLRLERFERAQATAGIIILLEVVFVGLVLLTYSRRLGDYLTRVVEQRERLEEQAAALQNQAAELEVINQELNESVHATEDALRATEAESLERARAFALLDASLDSAPVAVAVFDRSLHFVRVNRPWSLLDGIAPADHVGRRLAELPFSSEAMEAALPFLERCIGDATVASNIELSGRTAIDEKRRRFWLLSCAPVSVGGEPIGVVAALLDVTDRARLSEEFLQIQKMEAVGRLAGGIAHDFNNSLAVINAYASMLTMSTVISETDRSRVDEIVGAVERAASLTQQLLAFGRRQISSPRVVDMN